MDITPFASPPSLMVEVWHLISPVKLFYRLPPRIVELDPPLNQWPHRALKQSFHAPRVGRCCGVVCITHGTSGLLPTTASAWQASLGR